MTQDAWNQYEYNAWNRLVKVATLWDAITLGQYTYGPTARRIKKVVSNSGDRDTTEYYYYAGQKMIEARNGSESAVRQAVFGTQYVDEPIALIDDPGSYCQKSLMQHDQAAYFSAFSPSTN